MTPEMQKEFDRILQDAIAMRALTVAKIALKEGANPNLRTASGDTLLIAAIAAHDLASAGLLLRHGADVMQKNDRGETAMDVADIMYRNVGREAFTAALDGHCTDSMTEATIRWAGFVKELENIKNAALEKQQAETCTGTVRPIRIMKPLRISPKPGPR